MVSVEAARPPGPTESKNMKNSNVRLLMFRINWGASPALKC